MAGDFCYIGDWRPAIADCVLQVEDGALHRILTAVEGGELVEKRIAFEAGQSYTHSIVSSPLPIKNYTATFSIESLNGSLFSWSCRFSSVDPSMEGAIAGICEAGLSAFESGLADK